MLSTWLYGPVRSQRTTNTYHVPAGMPTHKVSDLAEVVRRENRSVVIRRALTRLFLNLLELSAGPVLCGAAGVLGLYARSARSIPLVLGIGATGTYLMSYTDHCFLSIIQCVVVIRAIADDKWVSETVGEVQVIASRSEVGVNDETGVIRAILHQDVHKVEKPIV